MSVAKAKKAYFAALAAGSVVYASLAILNNVPEQVLGAVLAGAGIWVVTYFTTNAQ